MGSVGACWWTIELLTTAVACWSTMSYADGAYIIGDLAACARCMESVWERAHCGGKDEAGSARIDDSVSVLAESSELML